MMRLFFLLTLCLTLCANLSNAQEICNNNLDDDGDGLVDCRDGECPSKVCEVCDNGLDDDGDGFVDCYDKECTLDNACQGFFLGNDAQCEMLPDSFPQFQMKLKYKSLPSQANHMNRIIAGDINSDGVPELVTTYTAKTGPTRDGVTGITASKINIFQAPTGGGWGTLPLDRSIDVTMGGLEAVSYDDIAMADIDGDGCAEIFVVTKNLVGGSYKIVAYHCTGTAVWAAPINFGNIDPGVIGLADFDHDGLVELYSRTQVFDAHTGTLMGSNNIDNDNTGIHAGVNLGWSMNSNGPIAVDIDSSYPGLELVAGCRIYGVNINRGTMTATVALLKSRPEYATRTGLAKGNATSVADFNKDGFLDVLAVGSDGAYNYTTTIFFWDVQNNVLKKFRDDSLAGTDARYNRGWQNGAGRINIADIDGDTLMNAVYVSGNYLYALKEGATGLDLLWRQNITEETSGLTGCTAFDFNGDGRVEIVYRDEDYLYVYSTLPDGTVVRSTPIRCSSRSHFEYPIVVDADGDGSAEVCVTCSTTNAVNGRNLGMWDEAEVRVYESANEPWMPARKVWNQHGYFVTNVNDDLTIPRQQQQPHLIYAKNSSCNYYGTSRPLNSFMNQAGYLNASGCIAQYAPDLAAIPVSATQSIQYTPFTCSEDSIQITFKYMNRGDLPVGWNTTLNVSFYDGDPESLISLATRLETKTFEVSGIAIGDTITTTTKIKNPGGEFDLYVVVNDDGSTLPLTLDAQPWRIKECVSGNVINTHITPNPVPLVAEIVKDDRTCLAAPGTTGIPNDGAVRAYVSLGTTRDSTNFNFYWFKGNSVKPDSVDYVGATYRDVASGPYTVYASHKTLNCVSDTTTLAVNRINGVDTRIILEEGLTPNANPSARLSVVVNDTDHDGAGDPVGNFRYVWYNELQVFTGDTLGISHTLPFLDAGDYSVLVTDKVTGCATSASITIAPLPYDCPTRRAADYAHVGSIEYAPFTCPDDSMRINLRYANVGTNVGFGTFAISLYNGDPELQPSQAVLLGTKTIFHSGLLPGDTIATTVYIKNPGAAFDLYVVLNDDGTTIPLDLASQGNRTQECTHNNVTHSRIVPEGITVVPELVRDNQICLTSPGVPGRLDNGVVKAYVSVGSVKDSTNFDFYWTKGSTPIFNDADFVGHVYGELASDTYTVYALHKTLTCVSDTVTISVGEILGSVEASIIQEKDFDNVDHPNGELMVVVNDADHDGVGAPESNFDYAWYSGPEVLVGETLGTSYKLTGLGAGTYSVLVLDPANGCYDSAYATIIRKEIILGAEENNLTGVSLYPNPATEDFSIMIDNGYVGPVQVQLLSTTGKEIAKTVTNHKGTKALKLSVDTHSFETGVYLVKISLGKETLIKKWTKL